MRWYQFFCAFLLFLLFTHHCIVVFPDMPSSSRKHITTLSFSISFFCISLASTNRFAMSVIIIFCSFVIISSCSFFILCYVFLNVHKTTSTDLHVLLTLVSSSSSSGPSAAVSTPSSTVLQSVKKLFCSCPSCLLPIGLIQ